MRNSFLEVCAKIISRLCGPFLVVPVLVLYIVMFHVGLSVDQRLQSIPVLLFTNYIVPLLLFGYFRWRRLISDMDVRKREERLLLLAVVSGVNWVGVWYTFLVSVPYELRSVVGLFVLVLSVVVLLTCYSKVSIHTSLNTALYLIVLMIFGLEWWWLGSFIVLIAWSRWYLGHHTVEQLVLGVLAAVAVFLTGGFVMLE